MFAQVPLHGAEQFISLVQKCPGETKDIVVKRDGQRDDPEGHAPP